MVSILIRSAVDPYSPFFRHPVYVNKDPGDVLSAFSLDLFISWFLKCYKWRLLKRVYFISHFKFSFSDCRIPLIKSKELTSKTRIWCWINSANKAMGKNILKKVCEIKKQEIKSKINVGPQFRQYTILWLFLFLVKKLGLFKILFDCELWLILIPCC